MSRYRTRILGVAAAMAAVPALAGAAPRPAAIDSCVTAYMQVLAKRTTGLKLRESRFRDTEISVGPLAELLLTATDAHDNHTIGRAVCRIDSRGQVKAIEEASPNSLPPP
jgi:hypothetical protein